MSQTNPKPRRVRLTGDRNQCPTCGELFNSSVAFDKHRTGDYGHADGKGGYLPSTRRCLKPEEMAQRGMVKNEAGFWITKPMRKGRRFPGTTDAEICLTRFAGSAEREGG